MIRLTHQLFGTNPITAHCPGPTVHHLGWHTFVAAALGIRPEQRPFRESATLLTWLGPNRPEKPNGLMEHCAALFGAPVQIVPGPQAGWQNRDKLRLTAEALQDIHTDYVIGLDSSDVVLLDHPDEIVRRFRERFSCALLFNATGSDCWPPLPGFMIYEASLPGAEKLHGRCWLNTGCFVGHTDFCRRYFAHAAASEPVPGYETCDQASCKRTWPDWYPEVQIDGTCEIFGWFNERRDVLTIERSRPPRQEQWLHWLHNIGRVQFGVEIGVFDGSTADALLQEFADLRLWIIDAGTSSHTDGREPLTDGDLERIRRQAEWWTEHAAARRHLQRLDSRTAAGQFPEGSLDFAIVSAHHTGASLAADLHAWWGAVRQDGLLCGCGAGFTNAGEAVHQFAAQAGRQVEVGRDGAWAIRR